MSKMYVVEILGREGTVRVSRGVLSRHQTESAAVAAARKYASSKASWVEVYSPNGDKIDYQHPDYE